MRSMINNVFATLMVIAGFNLQQQNHAVVSAFRVTPFIERNYKVTRSIISGITFTGPSSTVGKSNGRELFISSEDGETGTMATIGAPDMVCSLTADELLSELLHQIQNETDGTKLSEAARESILSTVAQLESKLDREGTSDADAGALEQNHSQDYTSIPLEGKHTLLYTDTERTPQYVGPIKGITTQNFLNETTFQNVLTIFPAFPLLQIALTAERKIMDGKRMKIFFQDFSVKILGGIEIANKELKQKGVWKMVFVGEVEMEYDIDGNFENANMINLETTKKTSTSRDLSYDNTNARHGQRKRVLLRVMRTPNLYILAQDLR